MPSRRILVIDDSKVTLARARHELEKAGYQVTTQENAYRAIDWAIANRPDLIICDYTMPGMTADRIIPQLRLNGATARIPIIVHSSQADPHFVETMLGLGATAHMEKSGDYQPLIAKVRELLGESDFMVEF